MSTSYPHDHALMFRVFFDGEPSDEQTLMSFFDTWITNWEPWADSSHGPNESPTLREPLEDGYEPFYGASWWFHWTDEDRDEIYDHLIQAGGPGVTNLTTRVDWARVGYHDCTHPGAGGPCGWDEVREYGSVPGYIESMAAE